MGSFYHTLAQNRPGFDEFLGHRLGRVAFLVAGRFGIAVPGTFAGRGDVGRGGGRGSGMAYRVDLRKVGIRRT